MVHATRIERGARSIASLAPAVIGLEHDEEPIDAARRAAARGHFTPEEDDALRAWFARFLTVRAALLEVLDDLRPIARGAAEDLDDEDGWRAFLVAYTAACLLVRAGRFLVYDLATGKVIQRKLNEPAPTSRIPRKQYTRIYRSLTRPSHAWRLAEARQFAGAHRARLESLATEPTLAIVGAHLAECEPALDVGVGQYLKARLRYRWHSWRRRRASAVQRGLFGILEGFGRVIADVHAPWHRDRVTRRIRRKIEPLLEPGDVIITRHDTALSNLFLPGFWPHASLHVGLPPTRDRLAIDVAPEQATRWVDPLRVLEARKDGVLFRPLEDTLAVDAVAVLRPRLGAPQIAEALGRAIEHEGKLYNFDFDFFTADRLVCTEVVYRAYEGIGPIRFQLRQRAGRLALSAEDLLAQALGSAWFQPVAVFGMPRMGRRLITGSSAADVLTGSTGQGGP